MRHGFYLKMAVTNIKKNSRLYLPQMVTEAGLAAMFYILMTLSGDERLESVRGGNYLPTIMPLGTAVVGIMSVILIFYINSFLMKQRKREFGLYNVLGLEKRHVGRILFCESAISALCSVSGGILLGILLYKICALLICRILGVNSVLGFYHVSLSSIIPSVLFFLTVYFLAYCFNRIQIACMNPVELMQSAHTGEKEPKIKWVLLVVGLISLGTGYALAIVTDNPLDALNLFFIAVLLVILGTYCLFVTGTIALLKLLKTRKNFYYHPRHMISVSGLMYRMKQNAMGLASISILAAMVLVMVSTTVSMYAGIKDTLDREYPHDFYISSSYDTGEDDYREIPLDNLKNMIHRAADQFDLDISEETTQRYFTCAFNRQAGNVLSVDRSRQINQVIECFFVTAQEYQHLTGKQLKLQPDEIAVFSVKNNTDDFNCGDTLTIGDQNYICTETPDEFPISMTAYTLVNCYGIVVCDEAAFSDIFQVQKEGYGEAASQISNRLVIDFTDRKAVEKVYTELEEAIGQEIMEYVDSQPDSTGGYGISTDSVWNTTENLYGMYGTLLFLGLILTFVFLFATALIIYYKQISEGYEDRERFQIMQKVGMSSEEVQATIRSQILLVFFLPLLVAAVHMAFAFPMLTRLLEILFQSDLLRFFGCTLGVFGVFAVIYVLIYRITAKVYYRIVSDRR
ncbi:MAG: ABC transporter permease [Lachnospiraceae bacterium]|nr:ABC transporter permease [Lachnospiraceae bacterium]